MKNNHLLLIQIIMNLLELMLNLHYGKDSNKANLLEQLNT